MSFAGYISIECINIARIGSS